jgi:hypothetical protein
MIFRFTFILFVSAYETHVLHPLEVHADPGQVLDRLHRLKTADHPRRGPQHGEDARRRGLGEETAQAGRLRRVDEGEPPVHAPDAPVNEGDAPLHGELVQDVARGEIVQAIQRDSRLPHQLLDALGDDPVDQRRDLDVRVQHLQRTLRGDRLVEADPRVVVQDLPVQVRHLGRIAVADPEMPDPGDG